MGYGKKGGRPFKKFKAYSKFEDPGKGIVDDGNGYGGDDALDEDDGKTKDFSKLELKRDHSNRPLWACGNGRIFLETFSPLYKQAYDFLIAIAEPVCRPESMREYNLTPQSLYAAVSVGLETETVISVLNKLSKIKLPKEMIKFIHDSTANYGKVKLVLKKNRYFVESPFPEVLKTLLWDDAISRARIIYEMSNEMDGDYEAKSVEMRSVSFHGDGEDNITEISAEMVAVVHSPKQLPFEFRVLEACIETACSSLESETSTLEEEAYPALDELTFQLSTLNLERVRQIKSRLVALSGRVHKSANGDGFTISKAAGEIEGTHDELLNEAEVAAVAEEKEAHSFEIDPSQVIWMWTLGMITLFLYSPALDL